MILVAVIGLTFSVSAAEAICSESFRYVFSEGKTGSFVCYSKSTGNEIGRGTFRESLKGVKITWNGGSTQEFVYRNGAYYLGDEKFTSCN